MKDVKKVLMVCTKYDISGDSPWLTNEFAESLVERGVHVVVCFVDWSTKNKSAFFEQRRGLDVLVVAKKNYRLGLLGKAMKWFGGSGKAYKELVRKCDVSSFDVVVSFSPSSTDRGLVNRLVDKYKIKSFHVLWDFFPLHHNQIGLIPSGWIYDLARKIESRMLSKHDVIGLMSPANVVFFDKAWPEFKNKKKVVFPIWGKSGDAYMCDVAAIRSELGFAREDYVFVYGGQLNAGRGVELIFEAAKKAPSGVKFLIIGWGVNFEKFKKYAEDFPNVLVVPPRPRADYKKLISSCDCGLVLTDSKTSVPTFPSKTFDYFDVGLPILAHVESTTDYGEVISQEAKAGFFSVGSDFDVFYNNISMISRDLKKSKKMGMNGKDYLRRELQVDRAVDRFFNSIKF